MDPDRARSDQLRPRRHRAGDVSALGAAPGGRGPARAPLERSLRQRSLRPHGRRLVPPQQMSAPMNIAESFVAASSNDRVLEQAVERAVRAIPPLWPLASSVAVNPFLGQSNETLAQAGARLARVAGAPVTPQR